MGQVRPCQGEKIDACQTQVLTPEMMREIPNWQHTGFSVFADRRVDFKKSDGASVVEMRHLARYISKPPLSLGKILLKTGADKVIYRGTGLHKWHKPGRMGEQRATSQNLETYDVLDFLAALRSHILNRRQKYVGYYGQYSNKTRGMKRWSRRTWGWGRTRRQRRTGSEWAGPRDS